MRDAVSKIKRFLEEWIEKGEAPDGIRYRILKIYQIKRYKRTWLYLQREVLRCKTGQGVTRFINMV